MNIVRVGLDVPVAQSFDYLSPGAEHGDIGSRVLVQFGKRTMIGVVLEVWDDSNVPTTRLKHVVQLLRGTPAFSRDDLRLLRFASEYYHYPLGQVVAGCEDPAIRAVVLRSDPESQAGFSSYSVEELFGIASDPERSRYSGELGRSLKANLDRLTALPKVCRT